jgi:GntR family transcriptional regulator
MSLHTSKNQPPMYFRIEQEILEQIQSGVLKPGDQLPSEAELAECHGVSRITAKRALDDLVQQGRAFRQQGRGTFVARARIREISGFRSFSEDIRARGLEPSSRILALKEILPEDEIRTWLHLGEGEHAFLLKRIRYADQDPVAIELAYLPTRICPTLAREDLAKGSLFEILKSRFGIIPTWADSEIEAREATREEARLLGIKPKRPVLAARRITFSANYDVIECVESVYRGDRFTFYTGRQCIG